MPTFKQQEKIIDTQMRIFDGHGAPRPSHENVAGTGFHQIKRNECPESGGIVPIEEGTPFGKLRKNTRLNKITLIQE